MEIDVSQEQSRVPVAVLCIKGDINSETADQLLAAARQAQAGGAQNLLLDLSEVSYISSWGIRALSEIYSSLRGSQEGETAHAVGGAGKSNHLKLLNPTPQVQRVLSVAGLDLYLESYTDRRKAVESF